MLEYLTPFKLFCLWLLACAVLARLVQRTPVPEPEPDQVDLKTVREVRKRELWNRRHYNLRLSGKWVQR